MAHFYGVLRGTRGEATRCGSKNSGLTVTAASWRGSVRVTLYMDSNGTDMASVTLAPWRGQGTTKTLYEGPVSGIKEDKT